MQRRKNASMASYAKGRKPSEQKTPLAENMPTPHKFGRWALLIIAALILLYSVMQMLPSTNTSPEVAPEPPEREIRPLDVPPRPEPAIPAEPQALVDENPDEIPLESSVAEVESEVVTPPETAFPVVAEALPPVEDAPAVAPLPVAATPTTTAPVEPITTPTARLLTEARRYIADKQLTTPAGNNAYALYQQLNTLDPAQADLLLEDIVGEYLNQARRHIIDQQLAAARSSYYKIRDIAPPSHPVIAIVRDELVVAWLARAERQMASRRYLTPDHDNAWQSYRAVLSIAPDHPIALNGTTRIANAYADLASKALARNEADKAQQFIERGLQVAPARLDLTQLQSDVRTPPPTAAEPLLVRLRSQIKAGRLSRPIGDNAYETCRALLQRFPENPEVQAGMNTIAARYAQLAQADYALGETQQSLSMLNEGLALFPQHQDMQSLKGRIVQQIAAASR